MYIKISLKVICTCAIKELVEQNFLLCIRDMILLLGPIQNLQNFSFNRSFPILSLNENIHLLGQAQLNSSRPFQIERLPIDLHRHSGASIQHNFDDTGKLIRRQIFLPSLANSDTVCETGLDLAHVEHAGKSNSFDQTVTIRSVLEFVLGDSVL